LDNIRKSRVEVFDIDRELWSDRQGCESQHKRKEVGNKNNEGFSFSGPIEWIMRIVAWLRNQHGALAPGLFDEVMGTEIRHDFCSGEDLDMEFLLELMDLFLIVDIQNTWGNHCGQSRLCSIGE
jgi:hypothetical protein